MVGKALVALQGVGQSSGHTRVKKKRLCLKPHRSIYLSNVLIQFPALVHNTPGTEFNLL